MSRASGINKTGRTIPGPANRLARKRGGPPKGVPWTHLTREMLNSAAWRILKLGERRILDRLCVEHMEHSGGENGNLICTYADFEKHGVRRKSIATSLDILEALGWIKIQRGGVSYGGDRTPSRYTLTWLVTRDGNAATNYWKRITDRAIAIAIVRSARQQEKLPRHITELEKKLAA